jgi:hypothetical protein
VLSKVFRGKFLHHLKAARRRQRQDYHGVLDDLHDDQTWEQFLNRLIKHDWVVYCKRLFGDNYFSP